MLLQDIISHLEAIAPPAYQEHYDNAGLITGSRDWPCKGALVALDATEAVVDEAIEKKCNLIVAHHPIVFSGLKKLNGSNYVEKAIIKAIKNDIAIYAIHTNLDNILKGVNARIADRLGLQNRKILLSREAGKEEPGSGLIGELPSPLEETPFLQLLKESFGLKLVRHTPLLSKPIKKVALCGGAGSFLISTALAAGADAFVSSDIKYHEFFDANDRMLIADIGHYESEQYTIDLIRDILQEKFPTFAVLKTGVKTNPVHYFL